MSKETEGLKKKKIQPCITSMLSPSIELTEPSAVSADPIEVPFQSVKTKKRKRSRKSGEHLDNNPSKKPVKKTPDKMAAPDPNSNPKDAVTSDDPDGVELSPEMKELEKQLNTSMLININKCIAEALQPIKDSIDKIVNSSAQIDSHDNEIK